MTGEQLRAHLATLPTDANNYLLTPVKVDSKIRIHREVVNRKIVIVRVLPRAYESTTGEVRAFWPMYDCQIQP